MNYVKLIPFDTANGPGFRVSLFVAGCTLRCEGCFNPEAHKFSAGQPYTVDTEIELIRALDHSRVQGLSLLGGDPLEPKNFGPVLQLCRWVKRQRPTKDIWLWTGRTLEEIQESETLCQILDCVDVLIEGRFIQELTKPGLQYRGSTNQRIINTKDNRE